LKNTSDLNFLSFSALTPEMMEVPMVTPLLRLCALTVSVFLLVFVVSPAQTGTGSLTVRVLDGSDTPMPGVELILTNISDNSKRSIKMTAKGTYVDHYFPYGNYQFKLAHKGYFAVKASYVSSVPFQARDSSYPLEESGLVGPGQKLLNAFVGISYKTVYTIKILPEAEAKKFWLDNGLGVSAGKPGEAPTLTPEGQRDRMLMDLVEGGAPFDQALAKLQGMGAESASPENIYRLGAFYKNYDKLDDSKAAMRYAGEKGHAEAYGVLGDLEKTAGRFPEAAEAYKKALEIKPDEARALWSLGQCQEAMKTPAEAVQTYERMAKAHPDMEDPLNKLAELYSAMGKHAEAKRAMSRLQALRAKETGGGASSGSSAVDHFNAGAICKNAGDIACAEREFIEAIKIDKNYKPARFELGLIYFRAKKYAQAKEQFENYKAEPDDANASTIKSLLDVCNANLNS
jgi:tetratricopeptide (TPR) repeat protein